MSRAGYRSEPAHHPPRSPHSARNAQLPTGPMYVVCCNGARTALAAHRETRSRWGCWQSADSCEACCTAQCSRRNHAARDIRTNGAMQHAACNVHQHRGAAPCAQGGVLPREGATYSLCKCLNSVTIARGIGPASWLLFNTLHSSARWMIHAVRAIGEYGQGGGRSAHGENVRLAVERFDLTVARKCREVSARQIDLADLPTEKCGAARIATPSHSRAS